MLGAQVPLSDIVAARTAHGADVVALSFSAVLSSAQVLEPLAELRAQLPAAVALWAGGSAPALARAPAGVDVVADFATLARQARAWTRPGA